MNGKKSKINISKNTSRVALLGILSAQALALSFIENFIPPIPGLPPGAKLGLANIVTMFTASTMGFTSALCVTIIKALFVGSTRGVTAFFMSLAGGVLSTIVMCVLLQIKKNPFGILGVSVACAIAHNTGQLIVATIISGTAMFASYAPFLLFFALVAGCITGSILNVLMPALERQSSFFRR
ncbi:MAG: Gx transporter family protein [Acutalibacteraceae bacterium]|jgi:heptaprenyl diphosphate synthase|nr:Gx transporter family protein [Clostridiales bacterium]